MTEPKCVFNHEFVATSQGQLYNELEARAKMCLIGRDVKISYCQTENGRLVCKLTPNGRIEAKLEYRGILEVTVSSIKIYDTQNRIGW